MKKVLLAIALFLVSINVYALAGRECNNDEIVQSRSELKKITYNFEYADSYFDENGEFKESYLKIYFNNLPANYKVLINKENGVVGIYSPEEYVTLDAGVYKVDFYSMNCDTLIKSYEFKVPSYKKYCEENESCSNVWYDGTSADSTSSKSEPKNSSVQKLLVIVLVIFILLAIIIIYLIITKRRKKYETTF